MAKDRRYRDMDGEYAWSPSDDQARRTLRRLGKRAQARDVENLRAQMRVSREQADEVIRKLRENQ